MSRQCTFKVYDNYGYKQGMCVASELGDCEMSVCMLKAYAVVCVSDEEGQGITDGWMIPHPDFPTYYMLKGIDLAVLAEKTGVPGILDRWLDPNDAVPVQNVSIDPERDGFTYGE